MYQNLYYRKELYAGHDGQLSMINTLKCHAHLSVSVMEVTIYVPHLYEATYRHQYGMANLRDPKFEIRQIHRLLTVISISNLRHYYPDRRCRRQDALRTDCHCTSPDCSPIVEHKLTKLRSDQAAS